MNPALTKHLKKLDGILISNPANITYLLGNDFGFSILERECLLLITKNLPTGKAGKKLIITDKRYSELVKKRNKDYYVIESGANYFLKKNADEIFKKFGIKKIGFEEDNLTFSEYKTLKKSTAIYPLSLSNLRLIKSEKEIENIRKSCEIGDRAFEYILKELKLNISEKEIAEKIVSFIKLLGADISFYPIVAFDKHSSVPHYQAGETKLRKDQIVLLDFGVKFNNYCSDMTRTVFFGKAPEKFEKIYKTVLGAQSKAISKIKIGVKTSTIDKTAREFVINQGYPNIIHSVGHGIGIEVHEPPHISPFSKEKVKTGMVFSVEPGIYIEGYGGIRIEDLLVITNKGAQLISHANREIIEVYAR